MAFCTATTHRVCVNEADEVLFTTSNQILLQHIETEEIIYHEITPQLVEQFPFLEKFIINLHGEDKENDKDEMPTQTNNSSKASWSRSAILALIGFYKDYASDFADTTIKNLVVWKLISEAMITAGFKFTVTQCQDKFKYLKQQYTKKVDNMSSNKCSGSAPLKFDYYDEMDDIFGKKPNIRPQHIASSSRKRTDNTTTDNTPEEPRQKKKKRDMADWMEVQRSNEKQREKRHQEKLALQKEALKTFKAVVEKLLDKLD